MITREQVEIAASALGWVMHGGECYHDANDEHMAELHDGVWIITPAGVEAMLDWLAERCLLGVTLRSKLSGRMWECVAVDEYDLDYTGTGPTRKGAVLNAVVQVAKKGALGHG